MCFDTFPLPQIVADGTSLTEIGKVTYSTCTCSSDDCECQTIIQSEYESVLIDYGVLPYLLYHSCLLWGKTRMINYLTS